MFITFEGLDGSGKTTQVKLLKEYFESVGQEVVTSREPGGTPFAEKIRDMILREEIRDPLIELGLLCVARRDHFINFIKPNLMANKIVICDRYIDSSFVYQGFGKGIMVEDIQLIHEKLVKAATPDLTFILDIEEEQARARKNKSILEQPLNIKNDVSFEASVINHDPTHNNVSDLREAHDAVKYQTEINHYDRADIAFFQKIRKGFLQITKIFTKRKIIYVNASADPQAVHLEIKNYVDHFRMYS